MENIEQKNNSLRAHQLTMLSMLSDLDDVCRKNNIQYSLFAGTALGAVRHSGFIPWDDDVDVILTRENYEKLCKIADSEFDSEKYYFQREFSPHWPMMFSKLRLNNTTCIEKVHVKDDKIHQGVYIDIFPLDNLSNNKIVRKMQYFASKIVIAKCLYKRGYETDSTIKKIFMMLCRALPLKEFWKFCVRKSDKNTEYVHSFFGAAKSYEKNIFPRKWFAETVDITFENQKFPISKYYNELLTALYGDYMTLPDEKDRKCKEHCSILDLKRPYTDYLDQQKIMKIDTFTRSIR